MSPRPTPEEVSGPRPLRLHSVSQYELDAIVKGRPPARPTMDRRAAAPRQALPVSETALELAADLDDYRKEIGRSYVVAEVAMAQRFADQLRSGERRVDLSVTYATHSEMSARLRHEKALENLQPMIDEARANGIFVHPGHARLGHEIKVGEILAETSMKVAV
jgi:hypothetical protein